MFNPIKAFFVFRIAENVITSQRTFSYPNLLKHTASPVNKRYRYCLLYRINPNLVFALNRWYNRLTRFYPF